MFTNQSKELRQRSSGLSQLHSSKTYGGCWTTNIFLGIYSALNDGCPSGIRFEPAFQIKLKGATISSNELWQTALYWLRVPANWREHTEIFLRLKYITQNNGKDSM